MPSMPLEVTRRVPRNAEQKWLLNSIIGLLGPDWDQGRLVYLAAVCGHDSQGDFMGMKSRVKTYNDLSREFMKSGRKRELRADAERDLGHEVTARESYFTAAILYSAAEYCIQASTPLHSDLRKKTNACYDQFITRALRHIERVNIPFKGKMLPALLHLPMGIEPGPRDSQLPCVVQISGMDGWKEMSVAMDGDRYLTRGVAVLVVDGPGQGESLTREIWYDPDTYGEIGGAIFDYLNTRPEVDINRVGLNGVSFGSYWCTQVVAAEPRFAACGIVMTCFEPGGFSIFETASPTFKLRFMYMTGQTDENAFEKVALKLNAPHLAASIECPMMVAAGEDDQLSDTRYLFEYFRNLKVPKTLVLYEGEDHGLHFSRAGQLGPEANTVVCDWLIDRLSGKPPKSQYIEVDQTGQVHLEDWGVDREYEYGVTSSTRKMIFG